MKQSTLKINVATVAIIAAFATSAAPAWAQDATTSSPGATTTSSAIMPSMLEPTVPPVQDAPATVPKSTIPPVTRTTTTSPNVVTPDSVPVDPAVREAADAEAKAKAEKLAAERAEARVAAAHKAKLADARDTTAAKSPIDTAADTTPVTQGDSGTTMMPPAQQANIQPQPLPPVAQPAPVEQPAVMSDQTGWWIGGGIAAAIIALALIGFALSRRRKAPRKRVAPMTASETMRTREPVRERTVEPVVAREPEPVVAAEEPVVERKPMTPQYVEPRPVAQPVVRTTDPRVVSTEGMGRHEAAAIRGPSEDNPFLTRRARVRRARFYDRQERLAAESGRPDPFGSAQAAAAKAEASRRDTGIRTGKRPQGWSSGFKPAFGNS